MTPSLPLKQFVRGGNAVFTLKSLKTNKHFTFKARQRDTAKPVFVSVLTDSGFEFLGVIDGDHYRTGMRSKFRETLQAQTFEWFWRHADALPSTCEFHHEGRCCTCGRRLTTPESLALGQGPDCASR